jgi:4-hydroxybenzoate polyprenyltransferase
MIFALLRVHQWYKNLLIFLPLIFSGNLFNFDFFVLCVFGFFSLCFVSSSLYIVNDLLDIEKDKKHPEKKLRLVASGRINFFFALFVSFILLILGLGLGFLLDFSFAVCSFLLFFLGFLYSIWLKKEVIADVIVISFNFVLRAVSGAFLIDVFISPWLVLGVFFLAFFLVVGKRHAEVLFLKDKAGVVRESLLLYSKDLTFVLMVVSTSLLIVCFSLYSFFSDHKTIFIAFPFAFYSILRYFILVIEGSVIARNPEKAFMDKRLLISSFFWFFFVFLVIYSNEIFSFLKLI